MFQSLQDFFAQSPLLATLLIVAVLAIVFVVLIRTPREKDMLGKDYQINALPELEGEQSLDFIGHLNKGNEYLTQYEFDKALVHFQEALKLKNNDPSIHFKIGRIFLHRK